MLRILVVLLFMLSSAFAADEFSLTSASFNANAFIPTKYSCDGSNISPALAWNHLPNGTKSFALIVSDPDAPRGTFYHWLLFNIPASITSFDESTTLPTEIVVGKNSEGKMQYKGPCPPAGAAHHYHFDMYALDTLLQLPYGSDALSLMAAMRNHILGKASLIGLYQRS